MIEKYSLYLPVLIFGIMFFFSFCVAPITFKLLDETNSRKFIRGIFPYYYNLNLFFSLSAAILIFLDYGISSNFYLISLVCILFFISGFFLMPMINKYRDNNDERKFKLFHLISVLINFFQIISLIIIIL